jgi:glycosyltransferase involved in cell wall biosynthesis
MMRVLVLCEYPSLNGGEHSLLAVAKCLQPPCVEWLFAAPPAGPLADHLREAGWLHEPLVCTDAQGLRAPRSELRGSLAELIRRHRPHVVHANSVSMSRLAGPVVRGLNVASVGHLRDIVKLSAASIRDLDGLCRLLAVSAATRDWYRSCGVPGERIWVEYNGVDLDRFRPRPPCGYLHTELGMDRGARLVGTIGQIGLRKGTDVFMAAAAQVAASVCDVHFLIVGRRYSQKDETRAFEQRVRQQANRGVLRDRVHFLGVRDDIDRVLREMAVYVHAARQEPLGRVLLESAATGLSIVATDVGGTREIFETRPPSALLVPPDAVEPLAQSIHRALSDSVLRQDLGRAARRRAETTFDVRETAVRLADHYSKIAGSGS